MITNRYLEYYKALNAFIPKERLLHDSLSTLAFGTDASFYRLIPKLVVKAHSEEEVVKIITEANKMELHVTFRAAGTSLSGQAITDSILVVATHGFKEHQILDNGDKIRLQVGIRGAKANKYLEKLGKKIGPDPASIDSAMIGGIAANNASGMCCGTSENSYKTVADIRVVLYDGTILDTADQNSCNHFLKTHSHLATSLEQMAKRVKEDSLLSDRISRKFKIKNTTGYSLNSLVDYSNVFDIIKHLMIGSEGTLGFISDITYNTVTEDQHKALALIIFPNIRVACQAVIILKGEKVTAVEIMDRAALRSVEGAKGLPSYLKELPNDSCALLVETKSQKRESLESNINKITNSISSIPTELPWSFTTDSGQQALLWKVRKEIFATIAGMRKSGTTPIIEDICFPIESLADGTMELIALFEKHQYHQAVIFGHALEGNIHFVFNQDFQRPKELEKYGKLMSDVVNMVVDNYDGSLKAEHGTGRNMAPFVEKEWGEQAFSLMKEIKTLFDPKGILNRGVIFNDDNQVHLKNIKPIPSTRESVDRCMECGFCEESCVSEGLTLSPRQRIVAFKEMERLRASGEEPHRASEINKEYQYLGLSTCATDGLCAISCPLDIDTGALVKELRREQHSNRAGKVALTLSRNMKAVTKGARVGLNLVHIARLATGKKFFGVVATSLHNLTRGVIPLWNPSLPKGASHLKITSSLKAASPLKVIYFPSCITRSMGLSTKEVKRLPKEERKAMELTKLTTLLLERAGYSVIFPKELDSLCCGMAFSSKGFVEAGTEASNKLEAALTKASQNGKYPILCDMSPCLYTMKSNFGERLKLFEPAEFAQKFLLDKLNIKQLQKRVALFAVCSAKKMEVDKTLYTIAKQCASQVVVIDSNCCGFAGDRGFLVPQLNKHGLRDVARQSLGCSEGYSTSKTCEIGLSNHSGINFSSILYLLEEASRG